MTRYNEPTMNDYLTAANLTLDEIADFIVDAANRVGVTPSADAIAVGAAMLIASRITGKPMTAAEAIYAAQNREELGPLG